MRRLTRATLVGILILSCSSDPPVGPVLDPNACATFSPDSVFALTPDSLRLVVGAADDGYVLWGIDCSEPFFASRPPDIDWTIRDTQIAESDFEDGSSISIEAQRPGVTFVVAEGAGLLDSLRVTVPDTVAVGPARSVAAGGNTSCLTTTADDALCWGDGFSGVLGDPGASGSIGTCLGVPCSPLPVPRATGARSVAVGQSHACGLGPTGSAFCWGSNAFLQVGSTQPGQQSSPFAVLGSHDFTELALGSTHSCGLTTDDDIYCWGDHSGGRLGADHRSGPVAEPVLVAGGLEWIAVSAGEAGSCAVTDEGHLHCWGIFEEARPGTETCEVPAGKSGPTNAPCSFVPLRIGLEAGPSADSVLVAFRGRCGLTTQGSPICSLPGTPGFTRITGTGALASLTGGSFHHCGLTAAGEAWCWGDNGLGQLGDGTTASPPLATAVSVTGGHTFLQLAVGAFHTCGLTNAEDVWCWGQNGLGQAGVPVRSMPYAPSRVRGQG